MVGCERDLHGVFGLRLDQRPRDVARDFDGFRNAAALRDQSRHIMRSANVGTLGQLFDVQIDDVFHSGSISYRAKIIRFTQPQT